MKPKENTIKKIRDYFSKKRDIVAVYLYGSFARGEAKVGSDIDLAVVFNNDFYRRSDYSDFLSYNYELTKILGIEVEVKDLKNASLDFTHRVLCEGKLVLCSNEKDKAAFEESILRNYFDLKPLFDEYYQSLSEIAKKGELHVRYT